MRNKKQLAGRILKISPQKVIFNVESLADIAKAITRSDIRGLIAVNKITKSTANHQSRGRARATKVQKQKGRQRGRGSKKGKKHSILSRKDQWMARVRVQRQFLQELRDKKLVSIKNYHQLYNKIKGGYFRNKRHIKLYLTDYHLIEQQEAMGKPEVAKPGSMGKSQAAQKQAAQKQVAQKQEADFRKGV